MAGDPSRPGAAPDYLLTTIEAGSVWARIYPHTLPGIPVVDPLFFGPGAGNPPSSRFDDPGPGAGHPEAPPLDAGARPDVGRFGVCYLGTTPEAAFVETFLRRAGRPGRTVIGAADREARRLATAEVRRPVRLVDLRGPGLARAQLDAGVTTIRDYAWPQAVARVLWRHAAGVDGIVYHARHDPTCHAVALFDRARDALAVRHVERLDADLSRLLAWADQYGCTMLF